MRLVRVVTRARSPRCTRCRISPRRSSICPAVGRTSTTGSSRPVGRISCSVSCAECSSSYGPGVAETKTTWLEVRLELLEGEGAVVQGRGEAEAVVHQGLLTGAVAGEHAPGLGHGHVRLVHEHEVVVREIIQQRPRGLPRGPAGEVPRVVLDPQADPRLPHHLQVEAGALLQALRFQELVALLHPLQALVELLLDGHHGPLQHLRRGDEVRAG